MENERFELQNVADTVEIGSFQLQNAENSNENGRKSKSPPPKKNGKHTVILIIPKTIPDPYLKQ